MRFVGWLRKSDPLLLVVAVLLAAAVLIVYLQDRALRTLRHQRNVVLQTVAERHARSVATEIQRTFEAPVFETLSAVNHPLLRDGRLDLVADHYAKGLQLYPQVERFFLWTDDTETDAPGEVLFFDRQPDHPDAGSVLAGFSRDEPVGRAVHALARQHAGAQRIYAAVEDTIAGRRYHVLMRLFWIDARRDRYFALLGFLVNLDTTRTLVFPELFERHLRGLFDTTDDSTAFMLQVLDEHDEVVFGPPRPAPPVAARVTFPLRFYPGDDIVGRLAVETPARTWSVRVSPAGGDQPLLLSLVGGLWPSALPVLLIAVALGLMMRSKRRADELARMQATFIAHVSHQLTTPLSLLSAASESLGFERARTPEKLAQYLDIVRSETSRLSALVEHVLKFSKLDQGLRTYELEEIDLAVLVRESAEAFGQTLARDGFQFSVHMTQAPLWVRADPAAFEQVLVNLLDNAVKYSSEARGIAIRGGRSGAEVYFEVIDHGIGISTDDIGRIFERFYRGANASSVRRGFGLGLPIAREIVRAHGGRIDVESRLAEGTTFRVSLPRLRGLREAARSDRAASGATTVAGPATGGSTR